MMPAANTRASTTQRSDAERASSAVVVLVLSAIMGVLVAEVHAKRQREVAVRIARYLVAHEGAAFHDLERRVLLVCQVLRQQRQPVTLIAILERDAEVQQPVG